MRPANRYPACAVRARTRIRPRVELPVSGGALPSRRQVGPEMFTGSASGGRTLSPGQVEAIVSLMRLFVEDDLANGVPPTRMMRCAACRLSCPAPGFIRYDGHELCNPCATDYEVRRTRGDVRRIGAYLTDRHARRDA